MSENLSPIEKIKSESDGLRGTIAESLHDELTAGWRPIPPRLNGVGLLAACRACPVIRYVGFHLMFSGFIRFFVLSTSLKISERPVG